MTDPGSKPTSFFAELKRRRVIRVAIGYAAVVFVVLQGADLVFPALGVSESLYRFLVIISLVGFPVVLALAWLFDLTPEGVRLTGAAGEGDPVVARFRPWAVYGAGLLAVIGVIAIGWHWLRPSLAIGEVAAGADVIAVLPFDVRGEGLEVMGEGMVDLLSRNLDEVGAIRTIDPRTVLSRWNQQAQAGVELDDALQLGSSVQAGSILWGSVTAVGGDVRITGDLYTVAGAELASVAVDGSSDNVLALVDSFSVALLREVWRSKQPVPRLTVSAITTGNPAAIRAYLQGERFYRASQWDSAVAAFQRAVAADSAFALAHYKTARALLWTSSANSEWARQAADLAYRHGDRLPTRERTLVLYQQLRLTERWDEAQDSLRAYLSRYPDDPEAWFVIVDSEYHRRAESDPLAEVLTPPEERLRPFDRVLQLDPTYTPALIHPLEIALDSGDSALINRYLEAVRVAAPANTMLQEAYVAVSDALLNPGDLEALTAALTLVLRLDSSSRDLTWQLRNAAQNPLTRVALTLPAGDQGELIAWLRARVGEDPLDQARVILLGRLLAATGRLAAGWQMIDTLDFQAVIPSSYRQRATLLPSDLGYVDQDYYDREGRELSAGARLRVEFLDAIDRANPDGLRDVIARARARELETDAPIWGIRARAGEGFLLSLEGDPVAGLARVDSALQRYSWQTEPFRFRWVDWLTRYPDTRAQARPILELTWPGDPAYVVPGFYLLARMLEADGDTSGASRSYQRFVEIVSSADPGLLLQARVDSARAAMQRLGAADTGS
jgi:tetratricopeptide (TPR) repeat protein